MNGQTAVVLTGIVAYFGLILILKLRPKYWGHRVLFPLRSLAWPLMAETGYATFVNKVFTQSEIDTTDDTTLPDVLKRISEKNLDPSVKANLSIIIFVPILEAYKLQLSK